MLLRTLFDFIFSSPITVGATVVSVACVSILAVNISSDIEAKSDSESVSVIVKKQFSVSSNNNNVSVKQNNVRPESAVAPKRNFTNINRKTGQKKPTEEYPDNEQYYVEDLPANSDSPNVNNRNGSSIFNYSNVGSTSNAAANPATSPSVSSPSTSNTTATESSTGVSDSETSSPVSEPEIEPEDEPEKEKKCDDFPVSLEYEIPITADRTDSVSCVPIVANGRPCMCTHRIVDGDDITNWVEDNCGIVEENPNLLCN